MSSSSSISVGVPMAVGGVRAAVLNKAGGEESVDGTAVAVVGGTGSQNGTAISPAEKQHWLFICKYCAQNSLRLMKLQLSVTLSKFL